MSQKPTLSSSFVQEAKARLAAMNAPVSARYPGETEHRQPVHTVYGGAHLFKADSAQKLATAALKNLDEYAPDFCTFARAIGLPGAAALPTGVREIDALGAACRAHKEAVGLTNNAALFAHTLYTRVREKLEREAVEDQRIDFEDGYGVRPDAEEDAAAVAAALEVAKGMKEKSLAPFIGIRIKTFSDEHFARSARTLDLFVTTLVQAAGSLPENFVVTLPKITAPEHPALLADLFDALEDQLKLARGSLKMEFMIEDTRTILGLDGSSNLPKLLSAARGRATAAHFGTYDYTASCNITAAHQHMAHPSCTFAKHMMQVAYAGTGLFLSDGATNVMPVPVHRAAAGVELTQDQKEENRRVVHAAWRLHTEHIHNSLVQGFYQGWDLHPAQLPTRYAAIYAFFLESLPAASERLSNFIQKAAQATLVGDVFDDAATGQGLLNFFLRGINCGALSEDDATKTGLTVDEVRGRSFVKILKNRRA